MTSVVLGLDTQTTRIGVAACELEPPYRPLWAWTYSLREPSPSDRPKSLGSRVREVMACIEREVHPFGEVARLGIERGVVQRASRDYLWDAGGVYHLAVDSALRRFPSLQFVPLRVMEWKRDALGDGHAGKDAIAAWAWEQAMNAGWDARQIDGLTVREGDGADALGIAVAAAMVELEEAA